jgi:hypothetical protein
MPDQLLDSDSLPIIADIRSELVAAFAAAEQRQDSPAETYRLRGRRFNRPWLSRPLAVLVALVGVSGAGIAMAASLGGGSPVTPNQWASGKRAIQETVITLEQQEHLSILRNPRVATDAVDGREVALLSRTTFTGANGANFALSRRANGFGRGTAWVVPAAGSVCVVAVSQVAANGEPGPDAESVAGCEPNSTITAGKLVMYGSSRFQPDSTFVAGLVPDGVRTIKAEYADGTTESLPVHGNVYMGQLHGAAQLSFTGPYGYVQLEPVITLAERERRACRIEPNALHCPRG